MGDAVALDRIAQRADHCLLTDQFSKSLRPVFARKDAIAGVTWLHRHIESEGGGFFGHSSQP